MPQDPYDRLDALIGEEVRAGERLKTLDAFTPPEIDLKSLLGEMAALKQEIRTETRSSRQVRESLEQVVEAQSARRDAEEALVAELERTKQRGRLEQAQLLVDVIDRLSRSAEGARPLAEPRRRWFRWTTDPAAVALVDGLNLTLRSLRDRLTELGVTPIDAEAGRPFDPRRMEAIEVVERPELAHSVVVQLARPGYLDGERVLRLAQVVVNRAPRQLEASSPPTEPTEHDTP